MSRIFMDTTEHGYTAIISNNALGVTVGVAIHLRSNRGWLRGLQRHGLGAPHSPLALDTCG